MLFLDIKRDELLQPLQTVIGIVEKRHTLPILSNVLIETKANTLSVLASDQEIQMRVLRPLETQGENFSITVSAKKLIDIFRALPESIRISMDVTDHQLFIRAQKSRFHLQTLPAHDFPVIENQINNENAIEITQKQLKQLITQVQYAMAQQDIRYYLNGMLLVLDKTNITAVTTDGHRLCWAALQTNNNQERKEIILPRKTVTELVKLLNDNDNPVKIEVYKNQIKFEFDGIELISKLIDGKFPDYQRVIPTQHKNTLHVKRTTLQQALQRVSILSNEKFRGVRLVLTHNELKIICNNNEQEEAQEELEVDYQGDALDIGFNVTYLLDALNQIDAEQVSCHLGDANSSMLMTLTQNENYKYVIMPMRI